MTYVAKTVSSATIGICLAGCMMHHAPQPAPSIPCLPSATMVQNPEPVQNPVQQPKSRPPEQVQLLQDFAMKESPRIWQTIQAMRGEMTTSEANIKSLREELKLFGRNPDADDDCKALVAGLTELRHAYDAIFDKLEDAYIAAKKFEASPSRKDYQDMMKRALEDGIQDATIATERYKAMTRQK